MTYVELRQNLTGPSATLTTPERGGFSLHSPAQQGIRVRWSVSSDRRVIRDGQQELGEQIFELLLVTDDVEMIGDCIPETRPLNCKRVIIQ